MRFFRNPDRSTPRLLPASHDEPRWLVTAAICRLSDGNLHVPGLSGPSDELVLLVELATDRLQSLLHRGAELTIELWRGEQMRDRFRQALGSGERGRWSFAFRLKRGTSPTASSRLMARVLLDGSEVARSVVLLGRPDVDAQGRFPEEPGRPASAQTLASFEAEFLKLLGLPANPIGGAASDRPEKPIA
jgi:hypothetical protein